MRATINKSSGADYGPSAALPSHAKAATKPNNPMNPLWHSMATYAGRSLGLQTKLTVGVPDDLYEREADAVADRVMRMPDNAEMQEDVVPVSGQLPTVSRLQRKCEQCEDELTAGVPSVQRKSAMSAVSPGVSNTVMRTIASPGSGAPLHESVRSRIEPVLGSDLSSVRVHSGHAAQEASHHLNAKAFTHQHNIFLGSGQRATDTDLMAHETTHVKQQTGLSSPHIQRRIVMRTTTPEVHHTPAPGSTPAGTRETLRPLTDEEVESYINDIGTVHHDYDDIIQGTGEEFNFVSNEAYRRGLIISIIRNLHRVRTDMYFDNYQEAVREVRKRALISLIMRASQGRTRGSRPTGYPRSCGTDPGPRVSQAAGSYWIVHPDTSTDSYWFELSNEGQNNAYEALRTLIFNHQTSVCLRTLMHCDYMISAQQFFVMADVMGQTDFNQAVLDGNIDLEIRWNSYENIVADNATSPAQFQSLQEVQLNSESEFVIGDHVIFYNHDAFDDMNKVHHNIRGNFSNWRLENAIISDIDASGEFRFQGHGYFRPKARSNFVSAMVGKMNDLIGAAQSAISAGNTHLLGFDNSDGSRFEVVRSSGQNWRIHYHEGMGRSPSLPVLSMPLRRFSAADYPTPFVRPGSTTIRVRRPIESRRESTGSSSASPSSPSPLPMPGVGPGAPSPSPDSSPAPPTPETAPAPAPTPAPTPSTPTGPSAGSGPGPVAEPPAADSPQQQQRTPPQQQEPPQQPQPPVPTPPPSPCPFICTRRHLLGARTPQYGRGDDFRFLDFPSLSTSDWLLVAPFRVMPDSLLEFGMNNVLGLLAGADGRAMVSHFRGGTGATWTHGIGSTLNREATHCPSVNAAVRTVQTQLAAQMRTMRALGRVDCSALSLSPVPTFHFGFGDSTALKGIIGGTQGLEVYIDAMTLKDPSSCRYDIDLQFVVLDDFGVDTDDLYWPALIKFWILQHERSGNRPFINKLLIDRTITV